jgi:zinc protease
MLDRKTKPPFAKDFSFQLPTPKIISLDNHRHVIWLNDIQQEVVKLDIVFKAGKWHEPKTGVAYFTSHMIEKGTTKLNSKQIAELFDQQGAQIEISVGSDFTSIALYSLVKNFEKVIKTFFELLNQPTFPEEELNLLKQIFLQNLKVNNEKSSVIAARSLQKNIFGKNHPYGSSIEEPDLEQITTLDLSTFFNSSFNPYQIYLTGNLTNSQINILEQELQSIKSGDIQVNKIQSNPIDPFQEKIRREKSIQGSIQLGKRSIQKTHPDYAGLLLLNHILGGYFGSRLMKNIREEKGLTYGIYSSLNARLHASLLTIATDVNIDKIETTISEINKELDFLINTPVHSDELTIAKNHLLGNLQLEISNPFSAVEKIKHISLYNLPESYYTNLFDEVKRINGLELQTIAATQLSPYNFFSVIVA